jgi:uncharacterized membrane protein YbhN (UPF0104 family)
LIPGFAHPSLAAWIGVFLLIPLAYFLFLYLGLLPISALIERLPDRLWFHPLLKKLPPLALATERQVAFLLRKRPSLILLALLISSLVWILMVIEYGLMAYFLGGQLEPLQAVAGYTATRVAFLTPLPGGVGVLEAGQVLAMQAFGYTAALGISMSLLMRARDLLVGLFGLWIGSLSGAGAKQMPELSLDETILHRIETEPVRVEG